MYFDNKQDLYKDVLSSYTRAITYAVQHNPTGVYNYIKTNYKEEFPTYLKGFEKNDVSKQAMYKFLKMKAEQGGNANAYARTLLSAVPANPDNKTWLK